MGEVTLNLRVGGSGGGPRLPVGEKKPESLSPDLGKPEACIRSLLLRFSITFEFVQTFIGIRNVWYIS
jgi:hypothetical protein